MNKIRYESLKYLLFTLSIFFLGLNCKSSDNYYTDFIFGVKAGVSQIEHNANFINLPAVPNCCVPFGNSKSIGIDLSLFINKDFFSFFNLELAGSFKLIPANFEAREFIGYTEYDSKPYELYSIHNLNANIGYFSINPEIYIKPIPSLPLKIGFGGDIGTFLPKSFEQKEVLDPDAVSKGITFYDGSKQTTVKNVQKGELPVSAINTFMNFTAEYGLKISDNLFISPSVRLNLGMNNIIKVLDWKINSLSFDVAISFPQLSKRIDTREEIEEEPVINYDSIIVSLSIQNNKLMLSKNYERLPFKYNFKKIDAGSFDFSNLALFAENDIMQEKVNVKEDKNKFSGCCKIIIVSSTNRKYSEKALDKILKTGLSDIKIEKWQNSDNNLIYYRVISDCFENSDTAQIRKREIRNQILKAIPEAEMFIKCEHD